MRNYRHFAVGMNANGSKIKRIFKPSENEAYQLQWYGRFRYENPRYYRIELEDGRIIKDTELVVELPTSEVVH
jgi:hypothetical protein